MTAQRLVQRLLLLFFLSLAACGGSASESSGEPVAGNQAVGTERAGSEVGVAVALTATISPAEPGNKQAATGAVDAGVSLEATPDVGTPGQRSDSLTLPPAPTTVFDPAGFLPGAGAQFPALDNPRTVSAAVAAWLKPQELVMGVELNGEARAYPVRQAAYHHVINDEIAGEPFLVTF